MLGSVSAVTLVQLSQTQRNGERVGSHNHNKQDSILLAHSDGRRINVNKPNDDPFSNQYTVAH